MHTKIVKYTRRFPNTVLEFTAPHVPNIDTFQSEPFRINAEFLSLTELVCKVFGLVAINTCAWMLEDSLQFVLQMLPVTVHFTSLQSCALFS